MYHPEKGWGVQQINIIGGEKASIAAFELRTQALCFVRNNGDSKLVQQHARTQDSCLQWLMDCVCFFSSSSLSMVVLVVVFRMAWQAGGWWLRTRR